MTLHNKGILFIIDGLGDLSGKNRKTPLEAARKPHFNLLANHGMLGLMNSIERGTVPGSDVSHLSIFGYNPLSFYCGRGPLEALGAGIRLQPGDIAFRTNFATVDRGRVVDRRAGRIDTSVGRSLEKNANMKIDDVEIIFRSTTEHRGVLVLRGKGLSPAISPTDSHENGPLWSSKPLDGSRESEKTARILNRYTKAVQATLARNPVNIERLKEGKLPANIILARGAGAYCEVEPISRRFGISAACIAGGALYKGVARYIGMDVIEVNGATGTKNTNLKAKAAAVKKAIANYDLIFLHVKATDSFGHDGDFDGKKEMVERIDKELMPTVVSLWREGANVIITSDHSTPCALKAHSFHETPLLLCGNERRDGSTTFSESACMKGGLGHVLGKDIMTIMLGMMGKHKMYGT